MKVDSKSEEFSSQGNEYAYSKNIQYVLYIPTQAVKLSL